MYWNILGVNACMTKDEFKNLKIGDVVYVPYSDPKPWSVRKVDDIWVNNVLHYTDVFYTRREAKMAYIDYLRYSREYNEIILNDER